MVKSYFIVCYEFILDNNKGIGNISAVVKHPINELPQIDYGYLRNSIRKNLNKDAPIIFKGAYEISAEYYKGD